MKRIPLSNPEIAIKILKQAKKLISSDKEGYVCTAISHVYRSDAYPIEVLELLHIIGVRLEGLTSVISWVHWNTECVIADNDRKAYRLAWIDSMISIIKETGSL